MSTIVLIRHAIAEDPREGVPDGERPLTSRGATLMEKQAHALATLIAPISTIATSPLRRARQTAAIIASALACRRIETIDALLPGAEPAALAEWIASQGEAGALVAVGHEPQLGEWAAWALSGSTGDWIEFKKGGAALIEFDGLPGAGRGRLRWLLAPKQLRRLA